MLATDEFCGIQPRAESHAGSVGGIDIDGEPHPPAVLKQLHRAPDWANRVPSLTR
jgi:hypothetical protein